MLKVQLICQYKSTSSHLTNAIFKDWKNKIWRWRCLTIIILSSSDIRFCLQKSFGCIIFQTNVMKMWFLFIDIMYIREREMRWDNFFLVFNRCFSKIKANSHIYINPKRHILCQMYWVLFCVHLFVCYVSISLYFFFFWNSYSALQTLIQIYFNRTISFQQIFFICLTNGRMCMPFETA